MIPIFEARVKVRLKPGHFDSEGETVKDSLINMGFDVETVSTSEIYEISFKAPSLSSARSKANEMCKKLLANPVKDDYEIEVEKSD